MLRGWLLVLDLKEGLVECATVCVKSVVILIKAEMLENGRGTERTNVICVRNHLTVGVEITGTRTFVMILIKIVLVDHCWIKNLLNQLPKSCNFYLGCVKITNGVALKSK